MTYSNRSFLLISAGPGNGESPLDGHRADALVFDLTGPNSEELSRSLPAIARSVHSQLELPTPVFVRVASPNQGHAREQLSAVVQKGLAGIVLAGVGEPQNVRDTDVLLREFELDRGIDPGTSGLIVSIDSARSLVNCRDILAASDRLTGVVFDTEAFAASARLVRTRKGRELDYPRSYLTLTAAALGIAAYDTVSSAVCDDKRLVRDSELSRAFGFAGRFVASAKHLKTVNRVFSE
jgi:citrate lyase beta subunit